MEALTFWSGDIWLIVIPGWGREWLVFSKEVRSFDFSLDKFCCWIQGTGGQDDSEWRTSQKGWSGWPSGLWNHQSLESSRYCLWSGTEYHKAGITDLAPHLQHSNSPHSEESVESSVWEWLQKNTQGTLVLCYICVFLTMINTSKQTC